MVQKSTVGRLRPVWVTPVSAESKGDGTAEEASTTRPADEDDGCVDQNGWMGQTRPPAIVTAENELLPRSTSTF